MVQKMGRPPKAPDEVLSVRIDIRLTATEKVDFEAAAMQADLSLSEWMRQRLQKVAEKELKGKRRK